MFSFVLLLVGLFFPPLFPMKLCTWKSGLGILHICILSGGFPGNLIFNILLHSEEMHARFNAHI